MKRLASLEFGLDHENKRSGVWESIAVQIHFSPDSRFFSSGQTFLFFTNVQSSSSCASVNLKEIKSSTKQQHNALSPQDDSVNSVFVAAN